MLKHFRENLKTFAPVLWVVIIAFIAIEFAIFGGGQAGISSGAAAEVGEQEISWGEFERQFRNLEDQYRQAYRDQWSEELRDQLQVGRQAIDRLINRRLLLDEAERMGLAVTDEEVRAEILRIPAFQTDDGRFVGPERYETLVRRFGHANPSGFEEAIRRNLLLSKLQDVVAETVYVGDGEVRDAVRQEVERADIRYIALPRGRFAAEVSADPAALEAYYEANRDDYRQPEMRSIAYLLVDNALVRQNLQFTDEELRAYYDDNRADFENPEQVQARHILLRTGDARTVEEARAEIQALRQRIEAGEDFATVAQEASEDPGSAARGGDLGFFGPDQMVAEFEQAAFGAEVGDLVGPVETSFGVHLIEVTDRREAGVTPFEEARQAVRSALAVERQAQAAAEAADRLDQRLAELEVVTPESLAALAEEMPEVRFTETRPFARDGVVPGFGRQEAMLEETFSLAQGRLSDDPVVTPRGAVFVSVQEILEPRVQPLAEVEDQVRAAVEQDLQQERAVERLEQARAALAAGETSLDDLAADLGLEIETASDLAPGSPVPGLGRNEDLTDAALDASEGELLGPIDYSLGAVLAEVTGRTTLTEDAFAERAEATRAQLESQRAQALIGSMLLEQRRREGVRYSNDLIESFGVAPVEQG